MEVKFTVLGRPATQGSIRSFQNNGKTVLTGDNPQTAPWRQDVAWMGKEAMSKARMQMFPHKVAVGIECLFFFKKPVSEKKSAVRVVKKPDLDKLLRAIGDALAGIVYERDQQICYVIAMKEYGLPERAEIRVWDMLEVSEVAQ